MGTFQTPDGHVTDGFAKLMVQLASGYGSMAGKLSEAMIRVYAVGLGDLTYEQVRAAMGTLLRESTFWPSVADLRRVAAGSSPEDAAILAWVGLRRAAGEVGAWASLEAEDGAVGDALVAVFGSWPAFCRLEEGPEMHTRRQEFLAAYRAARLRRLPATRMAGLCEATGRLGPGSTQGRLLASGDVVVETGTALVKAP
jgi:hypothetical protein